MRNLPLLFSAISGAFCVGFGAFTAHALSSLLPQADNWIAIGQKYQMFHTLALLTLGFFFCSNCYRNLTACTQRVLNTVGICWLIGILGFSGNLYLRALVGDILPIWITPLGGWAFIAGWILLLCSVRKICGDN